MRALLLLPFLWCAAHAADPPGPTLRVGLAGSEPFVVKGSTTPEGIAVEIWEALAAQAGWRYEFQTFESVPLALDSLAGGKLDFVVGPVSITAERAQQVRFSQPYFASSLSILSRTESPSLWHRIRPFFSSAFFVAIAILLGVLTLVGALIWLAERRVPETAFPQDPFRGVANGIWFAIVTMSTVGYGDLAPRTGLGRFVTGIWIVLSVITATSLIAGIASTLTLSGIQENVISSASQMSGRKVAVVGDSPAERMAQEYGAVVQSVTSLQEGYGLLRQRTVDAMVFDRPQLRYFMRNQRVSGFAVSAAEYMRQNYGFAMPLASPRLHAVNVNLLQLQESGRVDRIVRTWLGDNEE